VVPSNPNTNPNPNSFSHLKDDFYFSSRLLRFCNLSNFDSSRPHSSPQFLPLVLSHLTTTLPHPLKPPLRLFFLQSSLCSFAMNSSLNKIIVSRNLLAFGKMPRIGYEAKCGGYFQLPSQKCFQLETQDPTKSFLVIWRERQL
jgi:hypothetical protein